MAGNGPVAKCRAWSVIRMRQQLTDKPMLPRAERPMLLASEYILLDFRDTRGNRPNGVEHLSPRTLNFLPSVFPWRMIRNKKTIGRCWWQFGAKKQNTSQILGTAVSICEERSTDGWKQISAPSLHRRCLTR